MKFLAVSVVVLAVFGAIFAAPGVNKGGYGHENDDSNGGLLGGLLGGKLLGAVTNTAQDLTKTVVKTVDTLAKAVAAILKDILAALSQILCAVNDILNQLSCAVGKVGGLLGHLTGAITEAVGGITVIVDGLGLGKIGCLVNDLIGNVGKTLNNVVRKVQCILDNLTGSIEDLLKDLEELVNELACAVLNLIAGVAEAVAELAQQVGDAVQKALVAIQAVINKVVELVNKVLCQLIETLKQNLPCELSKALIGLVKTVSNLLNQLDCVTGNILNEVEDLFTPFSQEDEDELVEDDEEFIEYVDENEPISWIPLQDQNVHGNNPIPKPSVDLVFERHGCNNVVVAKYYVANIHCQSAVGITTKQDIRKWATNAARKARYELMQQRFSKFTSCRCIREIYKMHRLMQLNPNGTYGFRLFARTRSAGPL
ncbi:hypothetical protein Bhyg_15578 [Pseudolycoriella hygida]|uniref:Uncharacterized protein n=1 Tax=Pseudolycoriella hygida TaxID=35572 RepID=A0A9Q0RVT7_9DIPT|nr:hypothetical protein Bhyg_15578 [Pseudolycoriella hygida]